MKKLNILIAGGTGLVGTYLSKMLSNKGYNVSFLSRREFEKSLYPTYKCDYISQKIDENAVLSADVIINLAGANIADKRWSSKRKKAILESRVKTTELIFNTIQNPQKNKDCKLKLFITASAVGYYGAFTSSKIFTENDAPHNDFLGNVCNEWENAADLFQNSGIRTVKVRTGVVLSHSKGALEQIRKSFKFGTKVILGSGKQFMPWIHITDLCNIYIKAIEDSQIKGAYNAVSPEAVNYTEFANILKSTYKHVFLSIKMPAFVLRTMLGEMSCVLLEGSRISADKIINSGFKFQFSKLKGALENLNSGEE